MDAIKWKPNLSLLALLTVVALASVFLTRQCSRPPDEHAIALDTLAIRLNAADSVERVWRPRVTALASEASAASASADSLRALATRLARQPMTVRLLQLSGNSPVKPTAFYGQPDTADRPSLGQRHTLALFDSLAQAYTLMVQVDSLNQLQLSAKDSIIAADRQYITALERVRDAGRVVVNTKPGRKILGCSIGPAALVGLDGQVSAGAGVACGFRF